MNVLIIQQRRWALKYGIPLAKFLKNKYPFIKFAAFVYKPNVWKYINEDNFDYKFKWLGYKNDDQILNKDIKEQIKKLNIKFIEEDLGIESIWKDLLYCDRSMVYTPGKKWRYSYLKQISDQQMIDLVKFNYYFIKNEIYENFKPDIVFLPNFGSLFHNVLFHFLKKKGINCWIPTASKISKRVILTNEIDYSLSPIVEKFHNDEYSKESYLLAKTYIKNFRNNYNPPDQYKYDISKSLSIESMYKKMPLKLMESLLKNFIVEFTRLPLKLYRQYKLNSNKLNPKIYTLIDNQSVFYTFKNFFSKYINLFNAKYFNYEDFSKNQRKYFYFPLHVEPEVSTNLWAPMFTNQLEVIRKSAISLPNEYALIVKDHPIFIGRRTKSYYKKIQGLPNVKLISPKISNSSIINDKNCVGSIVISGSVGFETILMQKHTLVFSKFFYTALPHATFVSDFTKLSKIIKEKQNINLSSTNNDDLLTRLVSVLYDNSFEISYSAILGGIKKHNVDSFLLECQKKVQEVLKNK